jgi:molecular chaperone GrpE
MSEIKDPEIKDKALETEPELIKEEEKEIPDLSIELIETKDRLLRIAADFENYKKTSQREQLNSIKFANEAFITNLLPIIDNLEQAVKSSKDNNNDVIVGVQMVLKQFYDLLEKAGVEVFSAQGLLFDPARHEALGQQVDDSVPEGTVIQEYQKGYLLHQRLLRPARVVIAKSSGN